MDRKRYHGADVSYSCDVYVLNFICCVTLMYFKMMMSCSFSIFAFPSFLVTWKGYLKGQLPHCPLKVTSQRSPFEASDLSFSQYYFLALSGKSNRNQLLKYFTKHLNFIDQWSPSQDLKPQNFESSFL